MTKIGMIGLGKLGSAVAKTLNYKSYDVYGYDVTPADQRVKEKESDTIGGDLWKLETTGKLYEQDSIEGVILQSDIIFVTIQTPHEKEFEGTTRIPEERRDFNYSYLIKGMKHINEVVQDLGQEKVVVIISTVLPGTIRKYIIPELCPLVKLAYSPQFIAMGTVMRDFLYPEFVLLGTIDPVGTKALKSFYEEFYNNLTPILEMRLESAELAKVAYNTYIGMKIVFANTMMEICEATDADVDEVVGAIKKAKNRLISPAYLDAGMGDGGGCFLADERIYTENGPVRIEDVEVGMKVLTKDGSLQTVIENYKRPYKGRILKIKARGLPATFATPEHPFHVAKDLRKKYTTNGLIKTINEEGQIPTSSIEEVQASNITTDHYILFPKPKSNDYNRNEDLNYLRVAGYYLSEGSIWFRKDRSNKPSRVEFNFHQKEDQYLREVQVAIKRMYPNAHTPRTQQIDGLGESVRFNNIEFCTKLSNDFGSLAENKFIPAWILYGKLEYAQELLRGLWRGDGSSNSEGFNFTTISEDLAYGVSLLLRRFDIPSTLQYHPKRIGNKDGVIHQASYEVRVRNAAYIRQLSELVEMPINHPMQEKEYPNTIFNKNDNTYHKIDEIEELTYEGTVYNLNVQGNHTYVCNAGLVNNCHPRDNIAMSWLVQQTDVSHNFFEDIMKAREDQAEYIANTIAMYKEGYAKVSSTLPVVLLGKAFKPETKITTGSPALLVANILKEKNIPFEHYDYVIDDTHVEPKKAIFCILTKHRYYSSFNVESGSIVIDPFGYHQNLNENVKVHKIGRKS